MSGFQFDLLRGSSDTQLFAGTAVAGCSWGNDSVALVQFLAEAEWPAVVCLYNDTGWSMPRVGDAEAWNDRVARMEEWAGSLGFRTARTSSIGMEALVKKRSGWPRQGMQFCTEVLKTQPTLDWLAEYDPWGHALCANGKRRAESTERARTEEWIYASAFHGGRALWQPLFAHDDDDRDQLIRRAGHDVLPHKSKECKVCVNENAAGLAATPDEIVADIARIEFELGFSSTGKPRTMFRPAKKAGATGIREVLRWANAGRGNYRSLSDGSGPSDTESGCDGGYCAS